MEVLRFHYFRENFTLSHSKERTEKICLNCNTELYGRYCHVCGQENIEPKESVWGLVTHFFYDITHFDGKFFSTLKYLAFRPGFLSTEYRLGRRASYLNPIRMYVFTSAIFFIIFFSVTGIDSAEHAPAEKKNDSANVTRARDARAAALRFADSKEDSAAILSALEQMDDSVKVKTRKDSLGRIDTIRSKRRGWSFGMNKYNYSTVPQYDSVQKTLPPEKRDGWFARMMIRRSIVLNEKYGDDGDTLMRAWGNAFIHQFPKLLFVSLPIFALILRLLYIRRRKQFYYVDHGIFSIHLYIFSFIVLLVAMGIAWLSGITGYDSINILQAPLWLYSIYYNYKAMRNFYGQGTGKTIVKFILLNMLAFISILFLFAVFFIFAAFQL